MKVAIIGGGAAGLFCAANISVHEVTVFEGTSSCGNKLMLTGGGRCNYTNKSTSFFDGIICGSKFARSCITNFGQKDLIKWFELKGLETVFEKDRAFPSTKKAADVRNLLLEECKKNNVKFFYNTKITSVGKNGDGFVVCGKTYDAVIVATGGKTFPKTGSDGSGNLILSKLGVETKDFEPKLGPIYAKGTKVLQGVSANVGLKLLQNKKVIAKTEGPIVFTHFGISGPAALDCSGIACGKPDYIAIDFLPEISMEELKKRVLNEKQSKTLVKNFVSRFVAKAIAEQIEEKCGFFGKRLCDLTNKQIENFCFICKNYFFEFLHFSDFGESWVCSGGANLSNINPKNMETKNIKNLFIIGEQLDMFGLCGGFNLQLAFSSAMAVAAYLEEI